MSTITRRTALGAIASLSARGGTGAALATDVSAIDDPLLALIGQYRAAIETFNASHFSDDDELDAFADVTYGPPMAAIEDWEGQAVSRAGALAALELAIDETRQFEGSQMVGPLLAAALEYFELGGGMNSTT